MFLCGSRRAGEVIHNSWVMQCQLYGFLIALAYILNSKSLLKVASAKVHAACYALVSEDSSYIVTNNEYQKTVLMQNAFAKHATLLIDPVLGCGVAFMSVLNDRTLLNTVKSSILCTRTGISKLEGAENRTRN